MTTATRTKPTWAVPLSDVRLPRAAIDAATATLESGWLSSGPRVERFEDAFAEYVGTRFAVACSSGTAALQLAYAALGIGPGDEAVMPSLTFVAAANVAVLCGARPVFADVVGEDDLTVDPPPVARAIRPRTRAVVAMHYGGHPCSPLLSEIARDAGIALIEDAAHAVGASWSDGTRCGAAGVAGCFSFFANKNLPLGEGGMLTTDDDEVAARARLLRSHGMTSTTWTRHSGNAATYDVEAAGHNFRLDEPRAAMGTVLLDGLDEETDRRAALVAEYRQRLLAVPGVGVPFSGCETEQRCAHHVFVVVLPDGTDREAVRASMAQAGVQTSVHYPPTHRLSAHLTDADLPRTEAVADRLLTLPLFGHMTGAQVEFVVEALGRALTIARR